MDAISPGLAKPYGFPQHRIVLLAPHKGVAKQGRKCSDATWLTSGPLCCGRDQQDSLLLRQLSWDILAKWPNHRSRNFTIQRGTSVFRVLQFHTCALSREVS